MRRLFTICGAAALLASSVMLSGCGSKPVDLNADIGKADAAIGSDQGQTVYGLVCGAFKVLDDGFHVAVIAAPGAINADAQHYVSLAETTIFGVDGKSNLCATPYPTSVAELTKTVTGAIFDLYQAYQAQGVKPPVVTLTAPPPAAATASADTSAASTGSASATTQ